MKRILFKNILNKKVNDLIIKSFTFISIITSGAKSQQFVNGELLSSDSSDSSYNHVLNIIKIDSNYIENIINSDNDDSNCILSYNGFYTFYDSSRLFGIDILDFKQGYINLRRRRINDFQIDFKNRYLETSVNLDTMDDLGWSLELNKNLDTARTYCLSLALDDDHSGYHDHFVPFLNDSIFNILKPYASSWRLKIGASSNPTTFGLEVGEINIKNFQYTNSEYIDSLGVFDLDTINFPTISAVISQKLQKHIFETEFSVPISNIRFLTFMFETEPKYSPNGSLSFPKNYFSCRKHILYNRGVALDDFKLKCPVAISGRKSLCFAGDTIHLASNEPSFSHLWSTNDTTKKIIITEPGVYYLETNYFGCLGKDSIKINYSPLNSLDSIVSDTILCEGQNFILELPDSINYSDFQFLWSDGTKNKYFEPQQTGIYSLAIKDESCIYSDTFRIVVEPLQDIFNIVEKTICKDSVLFLESISDSVIWFINNQFIDTSQSISYKFSLPKSNVLVMRFTGCLEKDSIQVYTEFCSEIDRTIFLPNAISSNLDNLNETFFPISQYLKSYKIQIMNRWGEILFKGNENQAWDGTYKDEPVQQGLYPFYIKVVFDDNSVQNLYGTVYVLK